MRNNNERTYTAKWYEGGDEPEKVVVDLRATNRADAVVEAKTINGGDVEVWEFVDGWGTASYYVGGTYGAWVDQS